MTKVPTFFELAQRATRVERPGEALRAVAALRERLETLESVHVANAVSAGWSWSRVAAALGVTKQAVHKKHARRTRALENGGSADAITLEAEARRAVLFARHEADRLGAGALEPVHLLLGLLHTESGVAAESLRSLGVRLEPARERARRALGGPGGREPSRARRAGVSARARRVFEQSLHEAVRLGHRRLGVEHLLLAVLRDEEGTPARLLEELGVAADALEDRLMRALEEVR